MQCKTADCPLHVTEDFDATESGLSLDSENRIPGESWRFIKNVPQGPRDAQALPLSAAPSGLGPEFHVVCNGLGASGKSLLEKLE